MFHTSGQRGADVRNGSHLGVGGREGLKEYKPRGFKNSMLQCAARAFACAHAHVPDGGTQAKRKMVLTCCVYLLLILLLLLLPVYPLAGNNNKMTFGKMAC